MFKVSIQVHNENEPCILLAMSFNKSFLLAIYECHLMTIFFNSDQLFQMDLF